MTGCDVAVVGGGAVGASIALRLARAGARVTILERGSGWAAGCSWGNAGLIVPSHAGPFATRADLVQGARWLLKPDSPLAIQPSPALLPWLARLMLSSRRSVADRTTQLTRELALRSLEQHAALAAEGLPTGFRRDGLLDTYWSGDGFARAKRGVELHAVAGLAPRVLDAAEALEEEPALAANVAGAVLYPDEAHCDPLDYVTAVGAAAEAAGARFVARAEVLDVAAAVGDQVLETTAGRFTAGAVVVAAGAWSRPLARTLGLRIPLQAGKGYTVDLRADGRPLPRRPLMLQEARVAVTPLAGRLRLAGTMELTGIDPSIDRRRIAAIRAAARAQLPGWAEAEVGEVWTGLRPCTPDGLPLVGWIPGRPRVALATGHAMLGLTLAPVTAELVADLLDGRAAPELAALAPDRFGGRRASR